MIAYRAKLKEFESKLKDIQEREFVVLFGEPGEKRAKTYAMPIAQYRLQSRSGIRVVA